MKKELMVPILFFILAALAPTGSVGAGILFGTLFLLGWVTAIRAGRPVVAFYGSLGVIAVAALFMVGVLNHPN